MKLYTQFDYQKLCTSVLEEKLNALQIRFRMPALGEIELLESISSEKLAELESTLHQFGIQIIENQKTVLVQKIKDTIVEMIHQDEPITIKTSTFLAEKLKHSYGYLSSLFSEVTHTSIENYLIIQKIEMAKNLIIKNNMTLTEVAHKLNYSSTAHLSSQFKNTTGLTPSQFQRIQIKRRQIANQL